jgi:hypothetical protein
MREAFLMGDKLYIAVLAGNLRQFHDWCRENNMSPMHGAAFFVRDRECIQGRRGFKLVTYGTYYERPDLRELQLELRVKEAAGDCVIE